MGYRSYGRNVVRNGNFQVWQRGTSFTGITSSIITADGWYVGRDSSSAVFTVTQDTSPPDARSTYDIKIQCTTADTTIENAHLINTQQWLEGYVIDPLRTGPMTLSFWVKAYQTGIFCTSLRSAGNDANYCAEYTINSSATWEKKVIVIPPIPYGTWAAGTSNAGRIIFFLATGPAYQGAAGWRTTYGSTANQTNFASSTSNYIQFAQVQLEPGSFATEFEQVPIDVELSRCQRYFQRVDNTNGDRIRWANAVGISTTAVEFTHALPVPMRSAPTVTAGAGRFQPYRSGVVYPAGNLSLLGTTDNNNAVYMQCSTSSGATDVNFCVISSTAATDYVQFSAEP